MKILENFQSFGSEDEELRPIQIKIAYVLLTEEEANNLMSENYATEQEFLFMIRQGLQNAN